MKFLKVLLSGAAFVSMSAYGNPSEGEGARIGRIDLLLSVFNQTASLSEDVPEITGWEEGEGEFSSQNKVREHYEYADFFFVEFENGAVCEAIIWADQESIARRLIGYEPPRDWYNNLYRVMTVLCPSGEVYRMMKRVSPKNFIDRLHPGPNRGEENYFFILGNTKRASPKA